MDFNELLSFRKMITPTIIQILFWIGAGLAALGGLIMIIGGLVTRGGAGLMFVGLIYLLVGPILIRVYCELIILFFKIYDEIVAIRKSVAPPGNEAAGFPVTPVAPLTPPPAQ
jgi:hypothetical protein